MLCFTMIGILNIKGNRVTCLITMQAHIIFLKMVKQKAPAVRSNAMVLLLLVVVPIVL